MKPVHAVVVLLIAIPMFAERHITREQLPAAVAATVDRETKGATIKGFATERENGKQVWEAETIVNGHTRDLQIGADGALLEVEEEVPFDALSPEVQTALTKRAAAGKIVKVESLTKHGQLVAYEASTLTNGKHGEVQVGPNGKSLPHTE